MKTAAKLGLNYNSYSKRRSYLIKIYWKDIYGDKCLFCDIPMIFFLKKKYRKTNKLPFNYATVDHIDCKSLGGTDTLDNIQIICFKCNQNKSKLEGQVVQGIY